MTTTLSEHPHAPPPPLPHAVANTKDKNMMGSSEKVMVLQFLCPLCPQSWTQTRSNKCIYKIIYRHQALQCDVTKPSAGPKVSVMSHLFPHSTWWHRSTSEEVRQNPPCHHRGALWSRLSVVLASPRDQCWSIGLAACPASEQITGGIMLKHMLAEVYFQVEIDHIETES